MHEIYIFAENMEKNHTSVAITPVTGLTKVKSRSDGSAKMKLASMFFFMAFAFHTMSTVTFSLGADTDHYRHEYYHQTSFAAPLIGLLVTAYVLGLFAFIIILLLQNEDLFQLNQDTMKAVTLGCIFLQCELFIFLCG